MCVCTCSRSIVYRCDESRVLTCSNKLTPFLERKKIGFRANFCRNAIACENFELILLWWMNIKNAVGIIKIELVYISNWFKNINKIRERKLTCGGVIVYSIYVSVLFCILFIFIQTPNIWGTSSYPQFLLAQCDWNWLFLFCSFSKHHFQAIWKKHLTVLKIIRERERKKTIMMNVIAL